MTNQILIRKGQAIALIAYVFAFAFSWTLPQYADGASLLSCIAIALFITIPLGALIFCIWTVLPRLKSSPTPSKSQGFLKLIHPLKGRNAFATPLFMGLLVILLAEWSIFFLGLYPGITSTDSIDVFKMALGLPFESNHFRYDALNSHHPVLYTGSVSLILHAGAFLNLGEMNQVALTAYAHLIFLAVCCAWGATKLVTLSRSKGMLAFCMVFLLFDPLLGFYSVSVWKDVIFAGLLFVLMIRLLEYVLTPYSPPGNLCRIVSFAFLFLACALLRSNGIFIVGLTLLGLLFFHRKNSSVRRTVGIMSICVLTTWTIIVGPLSSLLQIQSGHFSESLSIPIQQIGRSLTEGGIVDEEDQRFLDQILPLEEWKSCYLPEGPNPIKFAPNFDDRFLEANKTRFIGTWLKIGLQNPGAFLRAWIDQTEAFWSIQASTWYVGTPGYSLTGDDWVSACKLNALSPDLLSALLNTVMSVFAPLFNIAFLAWIVIFLAVQAATERRWGTFLCLVPLLSLWACFLLAAPMNDFRYFFPVHLALPFLFFLTLYPSTHQAFAEPKGQR